MTNYRFHIIRPQGIIYWQSLNEVLNHITGMNFNNSDRLHNIASELTQLDIGDIGTVDNLYIVRTQDMR